MNQKNDSLNLNTTLEVDSFCSSDDDCDGNRVLTTSDEYCRSMSDTDANYLTHTMSEDTYAVRFKFYRSFVPLFKASKKN